MILNELVLSEQEGMLNQGSEGRDMDLEVVQEFLSRTCK